LLKNYAQRMMLSKKVKKLREKVQDNKELIAIKDEEIQNLNSTLKVEYEKVKEHELTTSKLTTQLEKAELQKPDISASKVRDIDLKESIKAEMFVEEEYGEKLAEHMKIKEEKLEEEEKTVELEELLLENIKHETQNTEDIFLMEIKTKSKETIGFGHWVVDKYKLVQNKSKDDEKVTVEEEMVQELKTKKVEHEYSERGQAPAGPPYTAMGALGAAIERRLGGKKDGPLLSVWEEEVEQEDRSADSVS